MKDRRKQLTQQTQKEDGPQELLELASMLGAQDQQKIRNLCRIYSLDHQQMRELIEQYLKVPKKKKKQVKTISQKSNFLEKISIPTISISDSKQSQSVSEYPQDQFRKIIVGLLQRVNHYKKECSRLQNINESLTIQVNELQHKLNNSTPKITESNNMKENINQFNELVKNKQREQEKKPAIPNLNDTEKWVTAKFNSSQTNRNRQRVSQHQHTKNITSGVHLNLLDRIKNQLHTNHCRRLSLGTKEHDSQPKSKILSSQKNNIIEQNVTRTNISQISSKMSSKTQSRRSSLTAIIQKMRTQPSCSSIDHLHSNIFLDLK